MKPILFNTEMVRAILEGKKTVTRRVVKPEQNETLIRKDVSIKDFVEGIGFTNGLTPEEIIRASYKAPYSVGDVLYVRETWGVERGDFYYKADIPKEDIKAITLTPWKPSIHMPREAARIFLRVTSVRVERLRDITDPEAEGIKVYPTLNDPEETYYKKRVAFKELWDSTIRKDQYKYYSWDVNPYVWVIEFERVEKPEAAV